MDPKQQALRNKQRERQQRGDDFQNEIRRSWSFVPNIWRMRIKDGGGGSRPGDEIILTSKFNILAEMKRTKGTHFNLGMLEPDQLRGLVDFDQVIERNYGLVFISFHNPKKELDEAYAFRILTALKYMKKKDQLHIHLDDFRENKITAVELPRKYGKEPYYDLQGVIQCYKSL